MFNKILAAKERLKGVANKTPVLTSKTLNKILDAEVFLKCENFQKVGAFKFRGAYNAISQLSDKQKKNGVITYSSGNHAQAVALVCKILNINAIIVMPSNAPEIKLAATKGYGANIIEYNPETEIREEVAEKILKEKSLTLIPPFDHEEIVAGQGTAALELTERSKRFKFVIGSVRRRRTFKRFSNSCKRN